MPFRPTKHRTFTQMIQINTLFSCVTLWLLTVLIHTVHSRAVIPNGGQKQRKSEPVNDRGIDLLPPEHIDGVKMDRNGELNKDFRQEVFLGPDHEDFDNLPEKEGRQRLIEIFSK